MNFLPLLLMWIGSADSSRELPEQEVRTFLSDNGFRYVTLVENSTVPSKTGKLISWELGKSGTSFTRNTFHQIDETKLILSQN